MQPSTCPQLLCVCRQCQCLVPLFQPDCWSWRHSELPKGCAPPYSYSSWRVNSTSDLSSLCSFHTCPDGSDCTAPRIAHRPAHNQSPVLWASLPLATTFSTTQALN